MKQHIHIVWFKRDLRVDDHAPLAYAVAKGIPVLPLYVIEKDYWRQNFASRRHWSFIRDCLLDLRQETSALGQPLVVRPGEILKVFQDISSKYTIKGIFSHEECGNNWTFQRDKRVIQWCKTNNISLHESPHNGVVRRLKSRDQWSKTRNARMAKPVITPPSSIPPLVAESIGEIPPVDHPMFGDTICRHSSTRRAPSSDKNTRQFPGPSVSLLCSEYFKSGTLRLLLLQTLWASHLGFAISA